MLLGIAVVAMACARRAPSPRSYGYAPPPPGYAPPGYAPPGYAPPSYAPPAQPPPGAPPPPPQPPPPPSWLGVGPNGTWIVALPNTLPNFLPGLAIPGFPPFQPPGTAPPTGTSVKMYMATWCSACTYLQKDLNARQVPYTTVDVDLDPTAYNQARAQSNTQGIPLTDVFKNGSTTWVEGADGAKIEQLYKN
jgi:glutaredoxin